MRTYHYSPSVKVYAAVVGKGGSISRYYDLSDDVTNCNVSRNSGAASTASVTLLNHSGKYNGVFSPFDLITVAATKNGEPIKLFTGYMTDVTRWTLYEQNFSISAKDCIYRLERLYFDPHLQAMRELMAREYSGTDLWGGYGSEIYKLLNVVGGMSPRNIIIGEMPTGVISWAKEMYVAQKSDYEQSEQIVQDMFSSIMSSSGMITGSAANMSGDGMGAGVIGASENGHVPMINGKLTVPEKIAQIAEHFAEHDVHGYSQPNRGTGGTETITLSDGSKVVISNSDVDCSEMARQCVCGAMTGSWKSPIGYMWTGNEDEKLRAQGFTRMSYSESIVRRGDVLWVSGHTGIAIGGGMQADAHGDEVGGLTGPKRGDNTGTEVNKRSLRSWTYIYRYGG